MTDKLPALESVTNSNVISTHVNALHSARRAYLEAESSEKVRKALKHKVRVSSTRYNNGEKVYYKRDGVDKWKGPGKVICQDGKIVFVRHGNVYVRVSTNRLLKVGKEFEATEKEQNHSAPTSNEEKQDSSENDEDDNVPNTTATTSPPELHEVSVQMK